MPYAGFPWESAVQAALGIVGIHGQSSAVAAQKAQLGAQFDALAGQVTREFNRIQAQPVITQGDYQRAVDLFTQLATTDAQYGASVPYIREQWTSANYKPAYESRLQQIHDAVSAALASSDPATVAAASGAAATSVLPGVSNNSLILYGAIGLGLFLILGRR